MLRTTMGAIGTSMRRSSALCQGSMLNCRALHGLEVCVLALGRLFPYQCDETFVHTE